MSQTFTRLLLFVYLFGTAPLLAQLQVVHPRPWTVIQRSSANTAPLYITGTFTVPVDQIEARLIPAVPDHGVYYDWTLLDPNPQNGIFQGVLTVKGGWYQLEIRGLRQQQTISQTTVERVGIGELFVVAGQSNAMGIINTGAKGASERVVAFDANNIFYNKNDVLEATSAPFPVPTFTQLRAKSKIFPAGETAWCWGELGDLIADRYKVPVAFFNASWPATVAENWSTSANGESAKNIFVSKYWPYLQPYSNLRNTLQYYHGQYGIRAVLWQHGESDAIPLRTSTEDYKKHVKALIKASRSDFGHPLSWVVSRTSYTNVSTRAVAAITEAQLQLGQASENQVWAGPNTDTIQVPRPAHDHFENVTGGVQGLSLVAQAWNQSLSDSFFKQSTPFQSTQFLRTGLLPSEVPAGTTLQVPVRQIGLNPSSLADVHLLNHTGKYVMTIGQGNLGNLQVRLPDTLSVGQYCLRVVATNPLIPGIASAPFRVIVKGGTINSFVSLHYEETDQGNTLHWLMAQEAVGSQYTVERMDSLGVFQPLATLLAKTDGALHHLYSFTDAKPLNGANRYCIRHGSRTGAVQYSPSIVIGLPDSSQDLLIFPIPTNGTNWQVRFPQDGDWHLQLTGLTGQVLWRHTMTSYDRHVYTLPMLPTLQNGLYVLHLQNGEQRFTRKVMIQH